jgi:hypothetical protein
MELQEWQKLSEEPKYRYSEELAANLPQSVIFKGLRFYPDGGPELSIAIFEYGGALFSLIPGGEVQIGYVTSVRVKQQGVKPSQSGGKASWAGDNKQSIHRRH